jgi:hypothetical protein
VQSLEELLLESGVISPPQLAVAQRDAEMRRKRLAQTLIDLGFISDRRFAEWMAQVTNLPVIDPLPLDDIQKLERRLPRAIAREYEVVPIAVGGNTMTIATINPLDQACLAVLKTTTGMEIKPVIAVYGPLMEVVTRFYPEDDVESTIQPETGTVAVGGGKMKTMERPFEFGSETLISSQSRPLVFEREEREEPGIDTRTIEARHPPSQLDRIENQLDDLIKAIGELKRRIDAIDGVLARVLARKG